MAAYELVALDEAVPQLLAPTSADTGVIVGNLQVNGSTLLGDITLNTGSITSASGAIDFGNENLTTTGSITANSVTNLVIGGMQTHMCVEAATRAAADYGFSCVVAADACATRDLTYGDTTVPAEHVHKAFLAALKSYGQVMKADEVIALLAAEMIDSLNRQSSIENHKS